MCTGIPLQVIQNDGLRALCGDSQDEQWVDMQLVGPQKEGTWVLVFLGAAREVVSANRAKNIADALKALTQVMNGTLDYDQSLFADLNDREPELPEHLKSQLNPVNSTTR